MSGPYARTKLLAACKAAIEFMERSPQPEGPTLAKQLGEAVREFETFTDASAMITVRMSQEMRNEVRRVAFALEQSMNEFCVAAIQAALEQAQRPNDVPTT